MKNQTTTLLMSEAQGILLADAVEASVNGVDLNMKGFTLDNISVEFSLSGTEANKNRVMFWLYSAPGDYIREPEKGGPLYAILGRSLTQEDADSISDSVALSFTSLFSGDLILVDCVVIPDVKSRRWKITLYVNDPIRREVFDVAIGVAAS